VDWLSRIVSIISILGSAVAVVRAVLAQKKAVKAEIDAANANARAEQVAADLRRMATAAESQAATSRERDHAEADAPAICERWLAFVNQQRVAIGFFGPGQFQVNVPVTTLSEKFALNLLTERKSEAHIVSISYAPGAQAALVTAKTEAGLRWEKSGWHTQ
jgi:hypothetical protein